MISPYKSFKLAPPTTCNNNGTDHLFYQELNPKLFSLEKNKYAIMLNSKKLKK